MDFSNIKVLVVDDSKTMRKLLMKHLEYLGIKNIIEAENGKEALSILVQAIDSGKPIDVIMSDWSMPLMSGLDLLQACRGNNELKNIPFVFVTAEGSTKQIDKAKEVGFSGYVTKPFSKEALHEKLTEVFSSVKLKS